MKRPILALAAAGAFAMAPMLASAVRPVRPAGAPPEPVDAGPPPEPPKAVEPARPAEPAKPAPKPNDAVKPPPKPVPATAPAAEAKPPEPKKIENPAEVTYRQKVEDHSFALHVRPGAPKPGNALELLLEISRLHDPPDPTYGDREPERDADLVLFLEKGKPTTPVVLHPMSEPGVYGAHVSAMEQGLYTVRIARRTGKPGLEASFPLGIGVATPARPDDVLASLPKSGQRTGRAIRPDADATGAAAPALPQVMHQLADRLLALDAALDGKGDAAAEARAMVDLSKAIPGQTPAHANNRPKEFDAEAAGLTNALQQLASSPTKARLADVEQNHCWRCHVQFRWGVASDVSAWPAFTQQEVK